MPLTMQIYGEKRSAEGEKIRINFGHLIVDRKNIIFAYLQDGSELIYDLRNKINLMLFMNSSKQRLADDKKEVNPNKTLHLIEQHLSLYDKKFCIHLHSFFKNDLTFENIRDIFQDEAMEMFPEVLSKECIDNVIEISREYFFDIKNSSTSNKLEEEYRDEKKKMYQDAYFEFFGTNKSPETDSSLESTFQSTRDTFLLNRGNK